MISFHAASKILNRTKVEILLKNLNKKISGDGAVRKKIMSRQYGSYIVFFKKKKKTDDARPCAKSGHCPFNLTRDTLTPLTSWIITFCFYLMNKKPRNLTKLRSCTVFKNRYFCKRFEPRSHFISRFSMIVRVNVVLNRTTVR